MSTDMKYTYRDNGNGTQTVIYENGEVGPTGIFWLNGKQVEYPVVIEGVN